MTNTPNPEAPSTPRLPRRAITGVLLLDKPFGLSSNAALQRARNLFGALKAGHTGTLDPHATGLLPLCFGEATKFSGCLLDAPKGYTAQIRLGYTSSTGDGEGEITTVQPYTGSRAQIEKILRSFLGLQTQQPPMYSALKVNGKPLYSYARAGLEVERAARAIEVLSINLSGWQEDALTIEVKVSKGTYIRVLVEDIGRTLGCGGYLSALRRTETGPFSLSRALTLEQLQDMTLAQREICLLPADALLPDVPRIDLNAEQSEHIRHGRDLPWPAVSAAPDSPAVHPESRGRYRVYSHERSFLGLCEVTEDQQLHAARLMAEERAEPMPSSPILPVS
jgi:tRNA pseudouridine55 synthase